MRQRSVLTRAALLVAAALALVVLVGVYFVAAGVSARPQPSAAEAFFARTVRHTAIGWHMGREANPVPNTDEAIAAGRAHFADHCASCHGNDGSGDTAMGRGLYPRAPDMRLPATQNLDDRELFYIIENGIRLTGMPAWSTGTKAGEDASWKLVRFIRHLPRMTEAELETMKALNPRSPEEIRQEIEAEQFLRGDDPAPDTDVAQPNQGNGHEHE